jgi:hypothetical protein
MFIGLFRGVFRGLGVMARACTGSGSVAESPTFQGHICASAKDMPSLMTFSRHSGLFPIHASFSDISSKCWVCQLSFPSHFCFLSLTALQILY